MINIEWYKKSFSSTSHWVIMYSDLRSGPRGGLDVCKLELGRIFRLGLSQSREEGREESGRFL